MRGVFIAIFSGFALAFPSFGEGVVTAFDLCPSPEALGFAAAFCALAEGAGALIFNPAGLLAERSEGTEAAFYLRPEGDGLLTAFWMGGSFGPLAAGFTAYTRGGDGDRAGEPIPHLGAVAGMGIWGEEFGFLELGFGISVRYVQAELTGYLGSGLALCLGALGTFPLGDGEFRLGLSVEDIGFGITFAEIPETYPWTTDVRLGLALVSSQGRLAADYYGGALRFGLGVRPIEGMELRTGVAVREGDVRVSLGIGVIWREIRIDAALDREEFALGFGVAF